MTPCAKSRQTNYTLHNESKPPNQHEPSSTLKVLPLNQPPLIVQSKRSPSSRSFGESLTCPSHPLPSYVPKYEKRVWYRSGPPSPPHSLPAVPKEAALQETHHAQCLSGNPQTPPLKANIRSLLKRTPISGNSRPGYREPPKPGPHLQPLSVPGRVTSSSNTESIMDTEEVVALVSVAAAPLVPHAVATRPAPQVPAPSNPALVRTLAAPLEFKPQPPPFFPALLPTETRRGHGGAGGEAGRLGPEAGQGSAGRRHLN